jgi:hypothetical protein
VLAGAVDDKLFGSHVEGHSTGRTDVRVGSL